jgi:hypothetical protein
MKCEVLRLNYERDVTEIESSVRVRCVSGAFVKELSVGDGRTGVRKKRRGDGEGER